MEKSIICLGTFYRRNFIQPIPIDVIEQCSQHLTIFFRHRFAYKLIPSTFVFANPFHFWFNSYIIKDPYKTKISKTLSNNTIFFFFIINKKFIEDQGKINTYGYTRCTSLVTPEKSKDQGILVNLANLAHLFQIFFHRITP